MNECLVYAIVIALLIVAILFSVCDSAKSDEGYKRTEDDSINYVPVTDFLTRRQCYFTQPDYGQLSYAGCRCSRVGTMMHNGEVTYDDAALYQEPL